MLEVDLPGVAKGDVDIQLDDGVLTVRLPKTESSSRHRITVH